jgi:four helix bundle protein
MHRFRALDVWRVAREVSRTTYRLTMDPAFRGHYALGDQIRRAAMPIPANLAEGYGLGTRAQIIRCARSALGSAYELHAHLELAGEMGIIRGASLIQLTELTKRTISLLIGLLRGLQRSRAT